MFGSGNGLLIDGTPQGISKQGFVCGTTFGEVWALGESAPSHLDTVRDAGARVARVCEGLEEFDPCRYQ